MSNGENVLCGGIVVGGVSLSPDADAREACDIVSKEIKRANWEFYEPYTEHGSSLSACAYGIVAAGMDISVIKDSTPVPHNGCRPPKRRRI